MTETGFTITAPCGHTAAIDDALVATDDFWCPTCGLRWHVETGPPTIYANGWIRPGDRKVVIDAQGELISPIPK